MSRRLPTAGLGLAALLAALAWTVSTTAKPPDLPLVDQDVLAPQPLPVPVEIIGATRANPFPQTAEPAAAAPVEMPLLFQLRPSARRTMASCLLFGAHPLLSLTPTEEYLDFDTDDAPALPTLFNRAAPEQDTTGSLIIGVGVNGDSGLAGSVEVNPSNVTGALACGDILQYCRWLVPHPSMQELEPENADHSSHINEFRPDHFIKGVNGPGVLTSDLHIPIRPQAPEPIRETPNENGPDDARQSVCPWVRQQQCPPDRRATLFADADLSRDVLQNLEMLHQAQTLLQTARELGRAGRLCEAMDCLDLAHDLCPGSRLDDAVQEAAVELFAPCYGGSPKAAGDAEEQSEPPAEKAVQEETTDCLNLFNYFFQQGDYASARFYAEIAQELDPNNAAARSAVGVCPCQLNLSTPSRKEIAVHDNRIDREIEMKLAQPASLHFDREPLYKAINDLQSWQNINVYVDEPALQAEEVSLDQPISVKVENVSLKAVLNLILKQARLTYVVKDGVLQITTEQVARGKMQRVIYQVADLLEPPPASKTADADKRPREEMLIHLITTSVEPRTWSENGGPGTIDFQPMARSLVVNQTPDVQESIVDLLDALRQLQQAGADAVEKVQDRCEPSCPEAVTIQPCLPPVDPETPAALDQLLNNSCEAEPAHSADAADADASTLPSGLDVWSQLADVVLHPVGGFEVEMTDKGFQLFTKVRCCGVVLHVGYDDGGLSVWTSPDGGFDAHMSIERIDGGLE